MASKKLKLCLAKRFVLSPRGPGGASRQRTQLMLQRDHSAYHWFTDRGKSRAIKF